METNNTYYNKPGGNESVFMDRFLALGHLFCALFGIVLNVTVILFILVRCRLRRQPRNIIWVGIGFSNIIFVCINLIESIRYYSPEATELMCFVRFFFSGFPGATFLMNTLFSLVDRYLSIFHPVWYRRCVTVRLVIYIQLSAFIVLLFLMKSHYIFGFIQVKCNVFQPLDRSIFIGITIFFILLCLFGQLTIYRKIKKYLMLPNPYQKDETNGGGNTTTVSRAPSASRKIIQQGDPIKNRPLNDIINEDVITTPEKVEMGLNQCLETGKVIKRDLQIVRIRYHLVSRLELDATRKVIVSVGIFLLFSLPWIVAAVSNLICNASVTHQAIVNGEETTESVIAQCSLYNWALSYTRLIFLIGHSIYQSVCYASRRSDFCAGLGQSHVQRGRECPKTRQCTGNLRRPHPKRIIQIQRQRSYNRHPGALLRCEHAQRSQEVFAMER